MTRRQRWWLLFVVLLAAALRLYRLDGQSFWADEGNSVALALRSLPQIIRDSAQDIHPPLYYGLLHGWVALFGVSEVAVRSLSVAFGVGTVALVARLAGALWGGWPGVAAALLLAVSPLQIYYAQEARMYALASMLGAGAALGCFRLADSKRPGDAALYVVCATLGLYTHYSFAFLLISLNIAYTLRLVADFGAWHGRLRWWVGAQAVTLLLYLPWLPTALARVRAWPAVGESPPLGETLALVGAWLYWGPAGPAMEPSWLVWLPLALALLALAILSRRHAGMAVSLSLWLVLPIVLTGAAGALREANLKFLVLSNLALALLMGFALTAARGGRTGWRVGWAALAAVGVAVPLAVALPNLYADPRLARDDYRSMARYIAAVARPDDAVLLNAPGQAEVFALYDQTGLPIYALPRQRPADAPSVAAELAALAQRHRHLYALFWATDESDPQRLVESWLDAHAFKAWDVWRGNVRFVLYAFPRDDLPLQTVTQPFGDPPVVVLDAVGHGGEVAAGDVAQVALRWRALGVVAQPYNVSVQLLDAANQVVAQRDAPPGGVAHPLSRWQAGETVTDYHGLFVPHGTPPGVYRLFVVVYDAETGARLPVAGGDALLVTTLPVRRPAEPPPVEALPIMHARPLAWDDVALLGYDVYRRGFAHAPDAPLRPGDLLHLTLYWQTRRQPSVDWRVRLEVVGGGGVVVAALDALLAGDSYPPTQWQAAEIVRGEHDLALPLDAAPGRHTLRLTLYHDEQALPSVALGDVVITR